MCGIVGIQSYRPAVGELFTGLDAIQRRGFDSAGVCFLDLESRVQKPVKRIGKVRDLVDHTRILEKPYQTGIGQVRYSTSGKVSNGSAEDRTNVLHDAQPLWNPRKQLAIAHNGQIHNVTGLRERFGAERYKTGCDVEHILNVLSDSIDGYPEDTTTFVQEQLFPAIERVLETVHGSYSVVGVCPKGLFFFKDIHGVMPLSYAVKQEDGGNIHLVSSETHSFHMLREFHHSREVSGGEAFFISNKGEIFNKRIREEQEFPCIFQSIYFSHADSDYLGDKIFEQRAKWGRRWAHDFWHLRDRIDCVIGVPETPEPAAIEVAIQWQKPYGGLIPLIDMRSFIQGTDEERANIVDQKFLPILTRIRGMRDLLFEDSIVRGNTLRRLIAYLKTFHPLELHVGSYFPQYKNPCPNGIDTATREELVACREGGDPERIARYLGADSVHYLPLESVTDAIGVNPRKVCIGCHTGIIPNDRGTVQQYITSRQKERNGTP